MAGIGVKIGTHTVLEIDRLADINNRPLFIAIEIAARLGWESGKYALNFF